jgi:tRNA pseudouridine38-40 synthase
MRNLRLLVAYDGTDFHGWQRQPDAPTVQGCLEETLAKLTGAPAHVWGSGRTDAGVHALNQVANFKTESPIPCENLLKALNNLLPPSVRVKQVDEAPEKFHARYDVRSKTYRYRILQSAICSPFLWRFVHHHPFPLDHREMAEAAAMFVGKRDFTSFAGSEGRADEEQEGSPPAPHSMVRTVFSSRFLWRPRTSMLIYEIRGSGFLHHMVRNIVGTLLEVGRGKLAPRDMLRILEARDRTQAGPTAPAQGLCLIKVEY